MSRFKNILFVFICFYPSLVLAEKTIITPENTKIEPFSLMNMANTVIGLVFVIALILALAWAVKKYGRLSSGTQADMRILGGLSLGTREKAILIEVEGKKLLLGVAPGRVETLHVLQDTEQQEGEFNKKLTDAMEVN